MVLVAVVMMASVSLMKGTPLIEIYFLSVAACRDVGIEVSMVTRDHPTTAFAIGQELGW